MHGEADRSPSVERSRPRPAQRWDKAQALTERLFDEAKP